MNLPSYTKPEDKLLAQTAATLALANGLKVDQNEGVYELLRRVAVKKGAALPHKHLKADIVATLLNQLVADVAAAGV